MFKFLKEKLAKATSIFSRKIEQEPSEDIEEKIDEKIEEVEEKIKGAIKKQIKADIKEIKKGGESSREIKKEVKEIEKKIKEEPEKKTFFKKVTDKITKATISQEKFEQLFWNLEIILMENNVAMEVVEKIKNDLRANLVGVPIERSRISEIVKNSLKKSIQGLFLDNTPNLIQKIKGKKPYVIVFVGINGSGKTTTIAKVADLLKKNNLKCVIAASDTFRAASIEQLEKHAENLGVRLIRHDYNADPAAVAFDAIKHAKAHNLDCVLIDTAGRMHSNTNLIDEMKKIVRVANPDLKIFVGESITGNDCVEQARTFDEAINIDGIILTKADVDEKGGAAISISYITKKPILYLGVGQNYADLEPFDSSKIMHDLGMA